MTWFIMSALALSYATYRAGKYRRAGHERTFGERYPTFSATVLVNFMASGVRVLV